MGAVLRDARRVRDGAAGACVRAGRPRASVSGSSGGSGAGWRRGRVSLRAVARRSRRPARAGAAAMTASGARPRGVAPAPRPLRAPRPLDHVAAVGPDLVPGLGAGGRRAAGRLRARAAAGRRADRDAAGAARAAAVGDPVRRHPRRRHLRAQLPRARRQARAPAFPARWSLAAARGRARSRRSPTGPPAAPVSRASCRRRCSGPTTTWCASTGASSRSTGGEAPDDPHAGPARRGVPLARLSLPVRALLAHARRSRRRGCRSCSPRAATAAARHVARRRASRWRRRRSPAIWIRAGRRAGLGPKHLLMRS